MQGAFEGKVPSTSMFGCGSVEVSKRRSAEGSVGEASLHMPMQELPPAEALPTFTVGSLSQLHSWTDACKITDCNTMQHNTR